MAITLVNLSGAQAGIENDETALNIRSWSVRYFPEFKRKLANKNGQSRGFAVPDKFSREINFSGEVLGTTGVLAAATVAGTAITVANDIALYTAVAGGVYLDEATESQDRDGWRSLDVRASSDPEVT